MQPSSRSLAVSRPALALLACLAVLYFHGLGRTDLWMDEIWWAFQVTEAELRDTLRLHAHARPPLLLTVLARGAMRVLPHTEAGFRTLPALVGLLAVVLFWRWAAFLPPLTRLALTGLFGVLPPLLTWTHLFKHYTADIAATLAAVLALESFLRGTPSGRRPYRLVLVLGVALGFSFPVFFFVGPAVALLLGAAIGDRGGPPTRGDVRPALLLLAVAAAYYRLWPNDPSTFLQFAPGSVPPSAWSERAAWVVSQCGRVVATVLLPIPLAAQAVGLLAGTWLALRERRFAGLWLLPVMAQMAVAGALGWFPLAGGRFTVFVFPLAFMTFGLGLHALAWAASRALGVPSPSRTELLVAGAAVILAVPGLAAFLGGHDARPRERLSEAIRVLEREYAPGDGVFLSRLALAGWQWYARDRSREVGAWRLTPSGMEVYVGSDEALRDATFGPDVERVFAAGKRRVLVLLAHLEARPGEEAGLAFVRRHLAARGRIEELHAKDGAVLWRVTPSAALPTPPPAPAP